jgi:hypothetical protein
MLSEKENFLRTLRGEVPEYVSRYSFFWRMQPSILEGERVNNVGKDPFGVEWTKEGSSIDGAMPRNDYFILDDIRKWRDVIEFPDYSGVDWEAMAKKDLKDRDPALPLGVKSCATLGFFQTVISFMGFTEGLIACLEEPDELKELVNYLCDCYLSYADKVLQYYKPDFIGFGDDIATDRAPFVSLETFRDIFAPVWRRYIKYFKDRGYLAVCHCCGRFEPFVDDLVDMGFNMWEPAQAMNDLVSIKKKQGNKLVICGGLDSKLILPYGEVTEEECRSIVKTLLDDLAPGGGYAFPGLAGGNTPVQQQRSVWVNDEYEKLKFSYYK